MGDNRITQRNFICDITAPLLVSRTAHIMAALRKNNVQDLFFCARDCHSDFLVSKRLSHALPQIKPHYLFFSREARDKDANMLFKYLLQEGVASLKGSAIVDASTNGDTLKVINTLLEEHGFKPCIGYSLLYLNIYKNAPHKADSLVHSDIMNLYTNVLPNKDYQKATNTLFPEHLFSLNLHRRTTGYIEHQGKIIPLFGDDDNNGINIPDYKKLKQYNDETLLSWTDAFIKTHCIFFAENIFYQIGLPSYLHFISFPEKCYVGWLKNVQRQGNPLVKKITPLNIFHIRDSWPQASVAETLSPRISPLVIKLLNSNRLQRLLKTKRT